MPSRPASVSSVLYSPLAKPRNDDAMSSRHLVLKATYLPIHGAERARLYLTLHPTQNEKR
jgi:hypothetical protein